MDRARACVCIPVFNNVKTVANVVRGALAHASTVLVCDDGSTDGSGDAAKHAGATVLTLERNQGKGAALEALFAEATKRGFRYALCLDADGQHLHEDLPKLAAATLVSPGALVVGARDLIAAGAPGASQFGRKFSNFWVWFESGAQVEDSQSGFRAYPLPEASRLHVKRRRYDYEVEILLKAAWAGVPIVSVPIGVLYPKDRVTHFRPFLDNTRISLLNLLTCIRLFFPWPLVDERFYDRPNRPGLSLFAVRCWLWIGGHGPWHKLVCAAIATLAAAKGWWWLLPLTAVLGVGLFPGLAFWALAQRFGLPVIAAGFLYGVLEQQLIRRVEPMPTWSGKRRGGVLGHLIFYWLIRYIGAAPAYLLLYPVALYFVFAAKPAREASREFLDRVLGPAQGFERHRRAFRHFHAFSRTLLDGFVLGAKGRGAFVRLSQGSEHFQNAASAGKGAVMVTAHIGNYQVASAMLESNIDTRIALVVFQGEEAQLKKVLERGTAHVPRIIAVGRDELSSLEILRALREGWLVAMQGDRAIDNQVVRVPFLGREAAFPVGPFAIAALSGSPLISTFGLQTAPRTYQFVADPPVMLRFERGLDRNTQLRAWVEAYVKRLEEIVRANPYQWFNFYDFWAASKHDAKP